MSTAKNPFEHILYEIEMYLATYKFSADPEDPLKQIVDNLIVDGRAIHLRNLAVFFYKEKTKGFWHVSDYLNSVGTIDLLSDETLFSDVKNYTSRSTAHLKNQRLYESYKADAYQCYQKAYPIIVSVVKCFFAALDTNVKANYKSDWEDSDIQSIVSFVKTVLLP